MKVLTVIVVVFLAVLCNGANQLTIYDNSTSNLTQLQTHINDMQAICGPAPISSLGLCNSTCQTCLSSDSTKCVTCSTGYMLSGTICIVDLSLYNFTYYNYMGSSLSNDISSLTSFQYTTSAQFLSTNDLSQVCQTSYQFLTAGLFQLTDIINLQYNYVDPIDQIQIKLNFASVVQSMALYITLNDNIIYSNTFGAYSDLLGNFTKAPNSTSVSFLYLNALNQQTASSIWVAIDTGLVPYIVSSFTIKFYVQSNSTQKYIWGFNDVVVFQRACQTCVSQSVQNFINNTGTAIIVTLIVVIFLVIVLLGAIKIQEFIRKLEFQRKLGSSQSNLPIKAIDRVIETVKKIRKTREKEMEAQVKKANVSYKKISKSKLP